MGEPSRETKENIMTEIYEKALVFATKAHKGQKRKGHARCPAECEVDVLGGNDCSECSGSGYVKLDYITHPVAVAEIAHKILRKWETQNWVIDDDGEGDIVKVPALLHDTIEDCGISGEHIEEYFGVHTRTVVLWMTKVEKEEYSQYFSRLVNSGCIEAIMLKLADITHNLSTAEGCMSKNKIQTYKICKLWLERHLGFKDA